MDRSGRIPAELGPVADDVWTAPFWAAAREHRLVVAQCAVCARFRIPPTPFCPSCTSQSLDWPELPGTASLFTYTIVRHAVVPALTSAVPYVVGLVELDGAPGVRLVTNIVDCDPDVLRVGDPLEVVWDDLGDDRTVPRFRPSR